MTYEFTNIIHQIKQMPHRQRSELLRACFNDPTLRDDLLDLAALIEAEAEDGEPMELEQFLASRNRS